MQTTILGRTGLTVSRMGIGGGGPSQLGRRTGLSEEASADLLRGAFDAGVNLVDSSEGYGTEAVIRRALEGRDRAAVVISTKKATRRKEVTPETLTAGLESSLRALGTDYIDIYNLHGVVPQDYDKLVHDVYPALVKAREDGKIRFVGVTEMFNEDLEHTMLERALADDLWDVVMVGFNLLNQTARRKVLPMAIEGDVGVQVMFAVRKALSAEEQLVMFVADLIDKGEIDAEEVEASAPLAFLEEAVSLPDAAYRFCRDEPGVHAVLSGTGNAEHLAANLATFQRPPLPDDATDRLRRMFRDVRSTTGQSVG